MLNKIYEYIEDIKGEPTAHLSGLKKVFLSNQETSSPLTQFAYGVFKPGEVCDSHIHPTMIECFFFIKGFGTYTVGAESVKLKPGTFLQIPANTSHELVNDGTEDLEFVYFGVATK
ncbi:MAG: cupin domain-containing protein [Reichenbachiella sp.]|uniref:cupin domain-containing protein n=1 Tax=Reichenbachiella sp. TaxID=2184521 RepID=UPI0032631DC9